MSTVADSSAIKIKLIERLEVAQNTMAFRFEKPDGWAFKAGQSVDMTLLEPPETDAEGNTQLSRSRALHMKRPSWWRPECGTQRSSAF